MSLIKSLKRPWFVGLGLLVVSLAAFGWLKNSSNARVDETREAAMGIAARDFNACRTRECSILWNGPHDGERTVLAVKLHEHDAATG